MRNPVIDIMKGIGIVLVLLGHISGISLESIDGKAALLLLGGKRIIYPFHMPLFFILAGYASQSIINTSKEGYSQFARNKFARLIVPYITSYLILILWSCIKAVFSQNWIMPFRHLLSIDVHP